MRPLRGPHIDPDLPQFPRQPPRSFEPRPAPHPFRRVRARLEAYSPPPGWPSWLYEFSLFVFKQGWACLFGALMLALLLATHLFYPADAALARYDFLTLAALAIQLAHARLRGSRRSRRPRSSSPFMSSARSMELFKTSAGSWVYPEPALLRVGGVPLFSGFMYAAVGSYLARVWRIFDFRFEPYPRAVWTQLLAVAVYVNFFAHHWLPDIRLALFAAIGALFWRTRAHFTVWRNERWMPLLVGWLLVAPFIWFAENLATFARAWAYPGQENGWSGFAGQARRLVPADVHLVRCWRRLCTGASLAPSQIR